MLLEYTEIMWTIWNKINAWQILLISRNSLNRLKHHVERSDTEGGVFHSESNNKAHLTRSSDFSWDTLEDFYYVFILSVWFFTEVKEYLLQLLALG